MKTKILLSIAVLSTAMAHAQNVGIGTTTPGTPLEVAAHGRTAILSYTDSAMGPSFTHVNYNNAPAGMRGEYRGTGANHGSGLVGTALSTQLGYGNGVTGKGGYVGMMGLGTNGGFAGAYAAADSATWGLYVDGNSKFKGKIGISQNASYIPLKELDVDGDANIEYSLKVGSTVDIVEDATIGGNTTIGGSIKIQGGLPASGKVLTCSGTNGTASWQAPAVNNSPFLCALSGGTVTIGPGISQTLNFVDNQSWTGLSALDYGNNFNNTTHKYTASVQGFYQFNFKIKLAQNLISQDGSFFVSVAINGNPVNTYEYTVLSGDRFPPFITNIINLGLSAGDQISIEIYNALPNNSVVINTIDASTSFSGYRVY